MRETHSCQALHASATLANIRLPQKQNIKVHMENANITQNTNALILRKAWYTTGEAARIAGVTPATIVNWLKAGYIDGRQTSGGHWRIPASQFTAGEITKAISANA